MTTNIKERVLFYLVAVVAVIFLLIAYMAIKNYESGLASLTRAQICVCRSKTIEVDVKVPKQVYNPTPKPKVQPTPVPNPAPQIGPLPENGPKVYYPIGGLPPN